MAYWANHFGVAKPSEWQFVSITKSSRFFASRYPRPAFRRSDRPRAHRARRLRMLQTEGVRSLDVFPLFFSRLTVRVAVLFSLRRITCLSARHTAGAHACEERINRTPLRSSARSSRASSVYASDPNLAVKAMQLEAVVVLFSSPFGTALDDGAWPGRGNHGTPSKRSSSL